MAALVISHSSTATGSPKIAALQWNAPLSYTGELPVTNGGTGAATAGDARKNLGLQGPVFSAYRASDLTGIPTSTMTEIVFDAEHFDSDNWFNAATGRFTPQVAGYYQFNACLTLRAASSSISNGQIHLYKNGSSFKRGWVYLPVSGTESSLIALTVSGLVYLNGSTDYVSLFAYSLVGSGTTYLDSNGGTTPAANYFDGVFTRQ